MKFEVLKKVHLKRNIIIGVGVILIISAIILNFTRAKYRTTQSIPLVNGTINYKPYDFKMIAMYQENENGEYEEIEIMPSAGYAINEEQSYCTLDGTNKDENAILKTIDGNHTIANLSKGSKCYLYFDTEPITIQDIIANKNLATRTDFSTTITEDTTGTIYYEDTSNGRTYYFAGSPTDNWVQFGGFYWRIIRINENGTIRMIYSGNEETGPAITGINTQIQNSPFNTNHDDNVYVGYMYTINELHGVSTSSIVKKVLDTWYQNNLANYTDEIDLSTGFCGDKTAYTNSTGTTSGGGLGITSTYYGAYIRLITNKSPTFECLDEDLYTTSESENGNKALDYPIGLITADEVAFAGNVWDTNGTNRTPNYLNTNQIYWTMSPLYNNLEYIRVFPVNTTNNIFNYRVYETYGVRPVINLRNDVTISSGDGTQTNPYIVN